MNIEQELIATHSKATTEAITKWIGDSPDRFQQLIQVFTDSEYRIVQRAVWVISKVGAVQPQLLLPHIDTLLSALQAPAHDAVERNVLKFFADAKPALNEDQEGLLLMQAFDLLADPQKAVAIRVHAMQCVANLCESYPELSVELREILEGELEHASAGFRSRAKKILASF